MEFVQPIRDRKKIDAMKKILLHDNPRDWCLFVLGINSALRIHDLLQLRLRDVLDDKGKVRDRVSVRESKTGKTKDFPLSTNAMKALQDYIRTRTVILSSEEPLFPSRKGGGIRPLQRAQAWKLLNAAAKSVGIPDRVGTHTLRKTWAYHAYKEGKDITLIQKALNHHSPATTLRYIGITQDQIDDLYITVNL